MDVFMDDLPSKSFNSNITTFPKNKQLAELLRFLDPSVCLSEIQLAVKRLGKSLKL